MRTAIFLGCLLIGRSICPNLEYPLLVSIFCFLAGIWFSFMDTYEFMVKNFKKK